MAALMAQAENLGNTTAMLALVMLSYMAQKVVPMALLGAFFSRTTTLPGLFAALDAFRLPPQVVLALMVAARFFPTIKKDAADLVDSLRNRRALRGVRGALRRPGRLFEYVAIPLLMRSMRVSDELAASALTRGLERCRRPTSLYPLNLGAQDPLVALAALLATAGLLCSQCLICALYDHR